MLLKIDVQMCQRVISENSYHYWRSVYRLCHVIISRDLPITED